MRDEDANELVEQALMQLRRAFDLFDLDRNGRLDVVELRSALLQLGHIVSEAEVRRLIASVDGQGEVDFDGFVRLVEPRPEGIDPMADLREVFQAIDTNGDGRISPAELRDALMRTDTEEATKEVERIFNAADTDAIDFAKFAELMS